LSVVSEHDVEEAMKIRRESMKWAERRNKIIAEMVASGEWEERMDKLD
jgi:hypothetical protein